jgi:hypothetical protein
MPTAGLAVAKTNIKHPELTDETFNEWYTNEHIHHVVDSGLSDLAIRYKNLNPKAKYQYLAVYRVPDVAKFADEKLRASIKTDSQLLPGKEPGTKGGTWMDVTEHDILAYETIQSFEAPNGQEGRGKGIVTVEVEPGDDDDLDDWYRKQVRVNRPCLLQSKA